MIDTDPGLSGGSADNRAGFKEIIARVCLGAIFGLEVSRLARSNADLAKLLELSRLTDTLVIHTDGVYDFADYSDRLILGFKSQMSEALSGPLDNASHGTPAVMPMSVVVGF